MVKPDHGAQNLGEWTTGRFGMNSLIDGNFNQLDYEDVFFLRVSYACCLLLLPAPSVATKEFSFALVESAMHC